ncbi:MAG: hypothetical protein WAT21_14670 [Saprospiraceae bacterium]
MAFSLWIHMIRRVFKFFILSALVYYPASAQEVAWASADSLSFWSDVMFNSRIPKHRKLSAERVNYLMGKVLSEDHYSITDFNPNIVRLTPDDKSFELFTWQYEGENNVWHYDGLVKLRSGKILPFSREQRDYDRIRFEEFTPENWYGAVYFYLIPESFGKENYYVMFGFAQNSRQEKFKIIEALRIKDDQITFGSKEFEIEEESGDKIFTNRHVVRYSQQSNCTLTYEAPNKMIVFDHIAKYETPNQKNVFMLVPDGTYEAFNYKSGKWKFDPYLPTTKMKEAPRDQQILDDRTKDLFGNPKKSK